MKSCRVPQAGIGRVVGLPHMSADEQTAASAESAYRLVFEKRAREWAEGRGLIGLLASLEKMCPHTFTVAATELGADAPRPWVPSDGAEEHDIKQAYRRASRLLHPDRLSQRDLSVRIEAEEVLKVLTTAFANKSEWYNNLQAGNFQGDSSRSHASSTTDLRDNIFGASGACSAPPSNQARGQPTPPPVNESHSSGCSMGGSNLRDNIFAEPKPAPPRQTTPFDLPASGPSAGSGSPFDDLPPAPPGAPSTAYANRESKSPFETSMPYNIPRSEAQGAATSPFDNPFGSGEVGTSPTVSDASLSAASALFSTAADSRQGTHGRIPPETVDPTPATASPWPQTAVDSAADLFQSAATFQRSPSPPEAMNPFG